jgi:hypothetical protein
MNGNAVRAPALVTDGHRYELKDIDDDDLILAMGDELKVIHNTRSISVPRDIHPATWRRQETEKIILLDRFQ